MGLCNEMRRDPLGSEQGSVGIDLLAETMDKVKAPGRPMDGQRCFAPRLGAEEYRHGNARDNYTCEDAETPRGIMHSLYRPDQSPKDDW